MTIPDGWQFQASVATYIAFLCALGSIPLVSRQNFYRLQRIIQNILIVYTCHFGVLMILDTTFLHVIREDPAIWAWWRRLYARNVLGVIHSLWLIALWRGRGPVATDQDGASDPLLATIHWRLDQLGNRLARQLEMTQQRQDGQVMVLEQLVEQQRQCFDHVTRISQRCPVAAAAQSPPASSPAFSSSEDSEDGCRCQDPAGT